MRTINLVFSIFYALLGLSSANKIKFETDGLMVLVNDLGNTKNVQTKDLRQ